jgi:Ca2+-binding RTX toxin-like protein
LSGGSGVDFFVLDTPANGPAGDRIVNFPVANDTIIFGNAAFSALGGPGPVLPEAFFAGAAAHDSTDRIIYNSVNGVLVYDADGNGTAAPLRIATLDGAPPLTFLDFLII